MENLDAQDFAAQIQSHTEKRLERELKPQEIAMLADTCRGLATMLNFSTVVRDRTYHYGKAHLLAQQYAMRTPHNFQADTEDYAYHILSALEEYDSEPVFTLGLLLGEATGILRDRYAGNLYELLKTGVITVPKTPLLQ